MRVSQLAQSLSITPDTVRYYTRAGFLNPKKNRRNGYKEYSDTDETRLRFILSARQLGFSVSDIREIFAVADTGRTPCPLVRKMIRERLVENQARLDDSLALRKKMIAATKDWDKKPDKQPTGKMICHLIEGFNPVVN